MIRTTSVVLFVCQLLSTPLLAQDHRQQIDGLIRAFRTAQDPSGGLGDGSVTGTAMVLTAAAHCHRMYHAGDGPWVTKALKKLILHRQRDGSFAEQDGKQTERTTRWVIAALTGMQPFDYAHEIEAAKATLGAKGKNFQTPFDKIVAQQKKQVAAGATLADLVRDAAQATQRGPIRRDDQTLDAAASTEALVQLVAAQVAKTPIEEEPPLPVEMPWSESQQRAFDFLLKHQKDAVFFVQTPGGEVPTIELTALALAALQTKPEAIRTSDERKLVRKGLAWLLSQQNTDGSFGFTTLNYVTSAAVAAFSAAKDPARFEAPLQRAQDFLLGIQHTEDRGFTRGDRDYGSIGYGGSERGDLSNLQFALESLHHTGLPEGHEAYAAALVFLQRTQNLKEVNDFRARTRNPDEGGAWQTLTSGDDGGAAYYPGNSPMGYQELPDGSKFPRSYGSMTYALLKAYTLCGVKADDLRVRAAVQWITNNWRLDHNPGADPRLPEATRYQGLYYYYMVMAQALDIAGIDQLEVPDEAGITKKIDWRKELSAHLEVLQAADGSWTNEKNGRWWEDRALLCTVYCLLALDRTNP